MLVLDSSVVAGTSGQLALMLGVDVSTGGNGNTAADLRGGDEAERCGDATTGWSCVPLLPDSQVIEVIEFRTVSSNGALSCANFSAARGAETTLMEDVDAAAEIQNASTSAKAASNDTLVTALA